jgi:sialidase-1
VKNWVIDKADAGLTRDNAAYSDIVPVGKNQIGILYEKDNYKQIIFHTVSWK